MAKAKRRQNHQHQNQNVVDLNEQRSIKRNRKQEVTLIPRNTAQEGYLEELNNRDNRIVFAVGPAGTGKTLLATLKAVRELINGSTERIIITRPAVSVDEQHGFLPGDLNQKMEPWTRPIFDVFEEYFSPGEIKGMIADGVIEISPLAYMRGRTFKNCIVLFDEAQNTTPSQMKMALTRIGDGSRMFVTGDCAQSDFKEKNGLLDFFQKLSNVKVPGIATAQFERKHVERDPVVAAVLELYGDE